MDGLGNPLRFILTPGQTADCTQAEPLLVSIPARYVIADKRYDSKKLVEVVEYAGATAMIPSRTGATQPRTTDFVLYAERARNFASFLYLAATMLWMK